MATTFARLCQQVDQTQKELEAEIRTLTAKIDQLETVQSHSKSLRSVRRLLLLGARWRERSGGERERRWLSGNLGSKYFKTWKPSSSTSILGQICQTCQRIWWCFFVFFFPHSSLLHNPAERQQIHSLKAVHWFSNWSLNTSGTSLDDVPEYKITPVSRPSLAEQFLRFSYSSIWEREW